MGRKPRETATSRAEGTKPLGALAAITLVLVFPRLTFERLKERPRWVLPLVFVVGSSMVSAIYAVRGGFMNEVLEGFAFRSGVDPAQVRAGFLAAGIVMAVVVVPLVTLLETLFFKLAAMAFGGRSRFGAVFAAVAHASIPIGIGALAFAALMPVTNSPTAGANLAFLVAPASHPLLWSLARQIDLFSVWFFVLLGIAAEPVFDLPKRRARLAALVFAVAYVAVTGWMGQNEATQLSDPYGDWPSHEVPGAVVHQDPDVSDEVASVADPVLARVVEHCRTIVGAAPDERIAFYLYASLDQKVEITNNAAPSHGVEWAHAVHVAWVRGVEPSLVGETMKVVSATTLGKVYNPLVQNGLAAYARGKWEGTSASRGGAELLERGVLPGLASLVDPVSFGRMDPGVAERAAGALVVFVIGEAGEEAFWSLVRGADTEGRASVQHVLESALGDSLASIERRWIAYLGSPRAQGLGEQLPNE